MVQVDPAGLVAAAQQIVEALAELVDVDPVHPPLAADPASISAAARLSTGGTTLVATLAEQATGLVLTAEQLVRIGGGFTAMDAANETNIKAVLGAVTAVSDAVMMTGWAPSSPPLIPDVRPPLAPPTPLPPEAISTAFYGGNLNSGEPFITAWTRLAAAAGNGADMIRAVSSNMPANWDSPVATPVAQAHLSGYADALDAASQRAQALAGQATQHVEQAVQARSEIASPQRYTELRNQLLRVQQANISSGGAYAIPLAQLVAQKNAVDAQTLKGYGTYSAVTEQTTAGTPGGQDPGRQGQPGAGPGSGQGEPTSPDKAGQLASMLPQLLGALGGIVGGLFGSLGQLPQGLMQAASQGAQSLSGMMKPSGEPVSAALDTTALDGKALGGVHGGGAGAGGVKGGGGGGGIGGATLSPAVMPTTGRTPTLPKLPGGGLPPPATPAVAGSGAGAMGMPMGGMGGMGAGHGGGDGGRERPDRPKRVVVPADPHTEAVTGKVAENRFATSSTTPGQPTPPEDDDPPQAPTLVVRRITMPGARDDD